MDVELLLTPHCPNAAAARTLLTACLRQLNLDLPVRERVGAYPSPTILIDGIDVMTAQPGVPPGHACRLDLPTPQQVLAALHRRATSSATRTGVGAVVPIDTPRWPSRRGASACDRANACSPPPAGNSRHPGLHERTHTRTGHMAITVRREWGQRRRVIVISGPLDARAVPSLGRALAKALRTGTPILIDITEAASIHRDALMMLITAYRQAERAGRPFLLRAEPTQIREILTALGSPPKDDDD